MAHSTADAEYIAADSVTRNVMWFRCLMKELSEEQVNSTIIDEDNMAFVSLSHGEGRYLTSKHIGLRYHYLKEKIDEIEIKLDYVATDDQLADLLTKPLPPSRFKTMKRHMVFERIQ